MKYIGVFFLFCISLFSVAQDFSFHSYNPFGLKATNNNGENVTLKYMFVDLDNDGDLDVIHTGIASIENEDNPTEKDVTFFIEKQLNNGSKNLPGFGPRQNYSNAFPWPSGYFVADIADINSDQKLDFIVCCQINEDLSQELLVYQNKGTSLSPNFEIKSGSEMGLDPLLCNSFLVPEIIDLDKDGDLDLFVTRDFEDQIQIEYYKNNQLSGTNALEFSNSIITSPNPTQGAVSLTIDPDVVIKQITLYNSVGTLLKSYDSNTTEINFSAFDPGIYFMALTTKYSSIRVKIAYIR